MGNHLSGSIPSTSTAGIDSYIDELNGLTYIRSLGSARFLKTIQGGSKAGPVVVKILVKPSPNLSFRPYIQALKAEQEALRSALNVFTYQCQLETDRAVYVIRQYFHASLYDRISTRPFLNLVEKKFITFQLLRALADCHARKVYHGDIKAENVLVTSWNWAYLSDFASFKPTYLPEDNPGDFSFFFDTSSRRSCYLSPERFYDPVREPGKAVQAGALPGQSPGLHPSMDVFALGCVIAELFLESSPTFLLSQLLSYKRGEYDPEAALQPIECPQIKSLVLHMIQPNPADRLSANEYLERWCASGGAFPSYFSSFLYSYLAGLTDASVASERPELQSDARILKLAKDFPRISGLFGFVALEGEPEDHIELRDAADSQNTLAEEGAVLLGSVLMALTRSCALPSSQIQGLDMLLVASLQLPDNLKLDRAVPHLLGLCFESSSGLVRAHSLRVLVQILASVTSITPINYPLFSEYLLPHLRRLVNDPEVMVRVAYARSIATLAQVAERFSCLANAASSETPRAPAESVQLGILDQVVSLLIDSDSGVKRALLGAMPQLCVLFGHTKTNDVLLSHMITYLNDRDWMLRCTFFEDIVGVGEFVGKQSLEEYILPLMIQAITDVEEFVIEKALCSLTSLARADLFSKMTLWELIAVVMPQLGHPNIWIRNAAAAFASVVSYKLTTVDRLCVLAPAMESFLRYPPLEYPTTPAHVMRALGTPIPRIIFDEALNWAEASTQMWDILQRRLAKQGINVSGVDADWLRLLDSLRWTPFDERRIFAMRECIIKSAKTSLNSRRRTNPATSVTSSEEPIHLQSLGVTPHTEFFSSPSASSGLHTGNAGQRTRQIEPNGTHRISLRPAHSARLMSGRANSFHDTDGHIGLGELSVRTRSLSSNSTIPTQHTDNLSSPVPVVLNLSQFNSSRSKPNQLEFQSGPDPRSFTLNSSLQALLHKKEREAFPAPQADFGTFVPNQPCIPTQSMIAATLALKSRLVGADRSAVSRGTSFSVGASWIPEGKLVTHLSEHKGAVNAVRVAPDHQFFVSGSDDGTIKVWDAHRLDRPITTRSRLTYFKLGGRVTCLTFLRNSYCVAAANDKGDIHIFRIELSPSEPSSTYSKCTTLRLHQLEGEYALAIEHLASEDKSLLIFTTNLSNICCLDLRTSKLKWKVANPLSYGTITSFAIDPQANWLLVGTMKGILALWDLRFLVSLRHWLHPAQCPIRQLHAHGSRQVWIVAGRHNEVSLWDISQLECKRVVMASVSTINQLSEVSLKPLQVDSEEELLCCSLDRLEPPSAFPDHSTTLALAVLGSDAIVTVGTDQTIRYFNLSRPNRSFHVLSSIYVASTEDDAVYRMVEHDSVPVLFESGVPASHSMDSPRMGNPSSGVYKDYSLGTSPDSFPRLSSRSYAVKPPRSPVHPTILSHHHHLQRPHLDAITDVQLLSFPASLLITSDRSGVIKILL